MWYLGCFEKVQIKFPLGILLSFAIVLSSTRTMADPNANTGTNVDVDQVSITKTVYENPENVPRSVMGSEGDLNLLTILNPETASEINSKWGRFIKKGSYYVEFPVNAVKKHFSNQLDFYKTEKNSLMVLTILVGATSVNWFVFADQVSLESKPFLIGVNALIYAYLVVNVRNWQNILARAEARADSLRRYKKFENMKPEFKSGVATISANFGLFLTYNVIAQGIINWHDLSQLASPDLIGFMLSNTVLGVLSSGIWDVALRKWFVGGRINKDQLNNLTWAEALISTTVQGLISMGINSGYAAIAAHGTAGVIALTVTSDRGSRAVSSMKDKVSWAYRRGKLAARLVVPPRFRSASSSEQCLTFLN